MQILENIAELEIKLLEAQFLENGFIRNDKISDYLWKCTIVWGVRLQSNYQIILYCCKFQLKFL